MECCQVLDAGCYPAVAGLLDRQRGLRLIQNRQAQGRKPRMKLFTLVLFCSVICPAIFASNFLPKDGNGLLDACSALVDIADNPSSVSSLSAERQTERTGQVNWCAGYLSGIQDELAQSYANLIYMGATGVTLAGPDKEKHAVFDDLRVPCVPDNATLLQAARVLVKWLREHPNRLHEAKGILIIAALHDGFPCQPPISQEVGKPTTAKP